MNNTLSKIVIFAAGAAIGSAVTWKILDEKYKRFAQEQIDSVKKALLDDDFNIDDYISTSPAVVKDDLCVNTDKTDSKEVRAVDRDAYENMVSGEGYTNYSNNSKEEEDDVEKPYVIAPEEFGELEDEYNNVTLWCHSDGILTDDDNNVIEDVDSIVGEDSLTHFGEYEDDSVFVRNDKLKCDYEILFVEEPYYSDIPPRPTE